MWLGYEKSVWVDRNKCALKHPLCRQGPRLEVEQKSKIKVSPRQNKNKTKLLEHYERWTNTEKREKRGYAVIDFWWEITCRNVQSHQLPQSSFYWYGLSKNDSFKRSAKSKVYTKSTHPWHCMKRKCKGSVILIGHNHFQYDPFRYLLCTDLIVALL